MSPSTQRTDKKTTETRSRRRLGEASNSSTQENEKLFRNERRLSIRAVPARRKRKQYRWFFVGWLLKELSGGGQAP